MKKILLFCLGLAFIGSLYSFKTTEKEKQLNIEKIVIENDLNDCNYDLYVETCIGWWYLKLKNGCQDPILATCKYTIYYDDGSHKSYTVENVRVNGYSETIVTSGNSDHSSCTADYVSARYV